MKKFFKIIPFKNILKFEIKIKKSKFNFEI